MDGVYVSVMAGVTVVPMANSLKWKRVHVLVNNFFCCTLSNIDYDSQIRFDTDECKLIFVTDIYIK